MEKTNIFEGNVKRFIIYILVLFALAFVHEETAYADEQSAQHNTMEKSSDNSSENVAANVQMEKIRVGYYEYPGFQNGAGDNEIKSGYGYEYLQKVSYYAGWKYEYVYGTKEELYDALNKGEIDIIGGISSNDEHADALYPEYPMGMEYIYIYRHKEEGCLTRGDIEAIAGKSVGIVNDSLIIGMIEEWKKSKGIDFDIVRYDSYIQLKEAFDNDKIEYIIDREDNMSGEDITQIDEIGHMPLYLCVSKNSPEIFDKLNSALERFHDVEPYFENKLYDDAGKNNNELYEDEIEWVNNNHNIKIGYLSDYLPYCDKDKNGNVNGLIKDIIPAMFKKLYIQDKVTVEYICYDGYEQMVKALNDKSIDIMFPSGGGMYYAEQNGIFNSSPVVTTGMSLAYTGKYMKDTVNEIAVNKNNMMQYYFTKMNFPDAKIILADSLYDCLDMVMSGKAGSTVINGLRVENILKNIKYKGMSSVQLGKSDDRYFAVSAGNQTLLGILNRGINAVGSDYGVNASYKYIGELYNYTIDDFVRDNLLYIGIFVFVLIICIVVIFIIRNRNLKVQAKKDREIKAKLEDVLYTVQTTGDAMSAVYETIGAEKWSMEYNIGGEADVIRYSDKYKDMMGITSDDISISEAMEYVHPDDRKYVGDAIRHMIDDMTCKTEYNVEYRHREKDGLYRWVQSLGRPVLYKDEKRRVFYGIIIDISERKEKERIEYESAHIDVLTKLFNRNSFEEEVASLRSSNVKNIVIITVDINRLKEVNDRVGHSAGDELIKGTAMIISDTFGTYGNCYRTGGDEFVVIIKERDIQTDILKETFKTNISSWSGEYVDKLFVSTGYASLDEFNGIGIDELIKISDKRMYEDKERYYKEHNLNRRM